jgi:hypothetical protein
VVREHAGDNEVGSELVAEHTNLATAEKLAKLLSDAEPGSTWYTVPHTN